MALIKTNGTNTTFRRNTITVTYSSINPVPTPGDGKVTHKTLIYTDQNGHSKALRGGPDNFYQTLANESLGLPFDARLKISNQDWIGSEDYELIEDDKLTMQQLAEIVYEGDDAAAYWERAQEISRQIDALKLPYDPLALNSGTFVDSVLFHSGLPTPQHDNGYYGSTNGEYIAPGSNRIINIEKIERITDRNTPGIPMLARDLMDLFNTKHYDPEEGGVPPFSPINEPIKPGDDILPPTNPDDIADLPPDEIPPTDTSTPHPGPGRPAHGDASDVPPPAPSSGTGGGNGSGGDPDEQPCLFTKSYKQVA
jgi:hypothetical protein